MMTIPLISPLLGEDEISEVSQAIRSGNIAGGEKLERFENKLAEYLGLKYVACVSSGSAAIEVAIRALGISNKEVITTATSCIPTVNSVIGSGNKAVMVDISREDYNIDACRIEEAITKNTGAILPVHLYGKPAKIDKIKEIGKKHGIPVIEDCAQSMGARYKGKMVGSFGEIGCFSLNITKVITTGEGGFIATNDDETAKKAGIIRNYGMVPHDSSYNYIMYGYNFKYTNLLAAVGLAQLRKIDSIIKSRRENAEYMIKLMKDIKEIQLPYEAKEEFCVHYTLPILLKKEGIRDKLKSFLENKGISVRTLFRPMCNQPSYEKMFGKTKKDYPNAVYVGENGFYLVCYPSLKKEQLDYMAQSVREGILAIR